MTKQDIDDWIEREDKRRMMKDMVIGERSEPTPLASNHRLPSALRMCGDSSCTICAEDLVGIVGGNEIERVQQAEIVKEIRDLRDFGAEHPEHAVEAFCRINELLSQLGDDE